jgi:phosphohistidine phosphatase
LLTLTLFRHAKSSWDNHQQHDSERPLNKQGKKDAPRMAAFLTEHGLLPDLILCSPSVRTRQTLSFLLEAFKAEPPILIEDALYHASASMLLHRLQQADADKRHVMLIGHNPGLHVLALNLVGKGLEDPWNRLTKKFPTAGIAVISFGGNQWRNIRASRGELLNFVVPKQLYGKE